MNLLTALWAATIGAWRAARPQLLLPDLRIEIMVTVAADGAVKLFFSKPAGPADVPLVVNALIGSGVDLANRHGLTLRGLTTAPVATDELT